MDSTVVMALIITVGAVSFLIWAALWEHYEVRLEWTEDKKLVMFYTVGTQRRHRILFR